MSKRFNLRFAIILTGSLAVLATGTHFLHAYQVRRTSRALLDRATQVEQEGQLDRAADYLGRFLSLNPQDPDAMARYGTLLADDRLATSPRAKARAWSVLNKVLYLDPSRNDVRLQVVRLAISLGQYSAADRELEDMVKNSPQDGELLILWGRCREFMAKYRDARTDYEAAIRATPHNLEGYERLARLLRTQTRHVLPPKGKPADALAWADNRIDEMVRRNADSFRAYLIRAAYRRTYGVNDASDSAAKAAALKAAAEDIATAQKLASDEVDVFLAAADQACEQKQLDNARDLLRRGRDRHPKDWRLHLAAARLENNLGRTDAAMECFHEGLRELPRQPNLQWEFADALTAAGRANEATEAIDQLEKENFPAPYLNSLRGRLLMRAEQWQGAITLLEDAYAGLAGLAKQPGNDAAEAVCERAGMWLGQCFEQIGDADKAFDAYGRVVARNEESLAGRHGMAMVRWSQGRLQEALDQYRQLMKLPNAPAGGLTEIARLTLLLNLKDPARPEVEQALHEAERIEPLPAAVVVLRAEFWAAQGKFERARETLLAKYGEAKGRPIEVWVALSAVTERQGRTTEALTLLDDAQRECGDSVDLRLARARHWLRRPTAEARTGLGPLAEKLDGFTADDCRRLLQGLGAAYVQAGMTAEARVLWERMAKASIDLRSRVALFDLAAMAGDDAGVDRWQDEIRAIEGPDGLLWRYARATALVARAYRGKKDGLAEARGLLADVKARRPSWSHAILCEARLNDIEGSNEVSLSLYLRAIELGEDDPSAIGRAVVLLHQRRRDAEANALLGRLPKENLISPDTQRAAAEVALKSQNNADALARAEKAVAADSKDYRDHLWLGVIRWAARQPERAEPALLKARDLAPAAPEVWTTLVQFLVTTGHKDRAIVEVAAADGKLTAPASLPALAQCHEVVGQMDRARELNQRAVETAGEDPAVLRAVASFYLRTGKTREAEVILVRLVRHSDGLARAWARRTHALVMVAEGNALRVRDALAMLDEGRGGGTLTPADAGEIAQDERTRAQLMAMQNTGPSRRSAAHILDGLIDRQVAGPQVAIPSDYLLAAQLYESLGDWPRAARRYTGLLSLPDATDPNAFVTAARSLIRHGDAESGRKALGRLEVLAPKAVATIEIRARLHRLQGRTAEAVVLVREFAAAGGAEAQMAAAVLEEFGELPEAEKLFRSAAAKPDRPQDMLALAYFLTRHGKAAEALDLCDRAWSTCPPVDVAQACLFALDKAPSTPEQLARVSARVSAAMAAAPDQINLVAAQAAVCNFQGRFDDAIDLYQRVLAKDAKHVTALNNLAWLLALQGRHAQEAVDMVNRATDIVGLTPDLLDTRAVAFLVLGRKDATEAAVKDLEGLVAEAPTPTKLFHLARAYDQLGRRNEALKWWQAAKTQGLSPDSIHPLERTAYERLIQTLN